MRAKPYVGDNFWRGARIATLPSLALWAMIIWGISALIGCTAPDSAPPALIGSANIYFVPLNLVPMVCQHPKSQEVAACFINSGARQIVMPLPQDYPGDEYARLMQWELAHEQQGWPDPADVTARLMRDAQ